MNNISISRATKNDSAVILTFIKELAGHVDQSDRVTATAEMIDGRLFKGESPAAAMIQNSPCLFR